MTGPALFVSTYPYALIKAARALGVLTGEDSSAEFRIIEAEIEKGAESHWPYVRTVEECKYVEPALLSQNASGALDECRSRTAGKFLCAPSCDVWLQVDDDIFATRDVVAQVIARARETRGVATVPYLLRDGRTGSVGGLTLGPPMLATWTGMGLTAMHRDAVDAKRHRPGDRGRLFA